MAIIYSVGDPGKGHLHVPLHASAAAQLVPKGITLGSQHAITGWGGARAYDPKIRRQTDSDRITGNEMLAWRPHAAYGEKSKALL